MKLLTVALQRLALHDLDTMFIKMEWFIKRWLSSKKENNLQTIRKPTRQSAVWVSIDYKDIDIKGDWTNQNHPATSIVQTSLPLTIPSLVHLVPRVGVKG